MKAFRFKFRNAAALSVHFIGLFGPVLVYIVLQQPYIRAKIADCALILCIVPIPQSLFENCSERVEFGLRSAAVRMVR